MNNKSTQFLRISVLAILAAVIVLLVLNSLIKLIFPLLAIILLFLHRDLVKQIYTKITLLLKRNQILGVLAIIGCFIGLTPFLGFLALKTGWDIKKNWNKKKAIEA